MNFDNTFNLIPINIITGFLGSGKTTLLSELLKNERNPKSCDAHSEDYSMLAAQKEELFTAQQNIRKEYSCIWYLSRSSIACTFFKLQNEKDAPRT